MQSPLEVRVTKQNASQQTAAAAAVAHEHKDLCDKKRLKAINNKAGTAIVYQRSLKRLLSQLT